MPLHLIKLSVGSESINDLKDWQAQRLKHIKSLGQKAELIHVTRHMPKRSVELLSGGSIYWVIKGFIVGRQKLIELRPVKKNGIDHCGIIYDKKFVPVRTRPCRAFQGWRYLEDAPPDRASGDIDTIDEMPEKMRRELMELGLL